MGVEAFEKAAKAFNEYWLEERVVDGEVIPSIISWHSVSFETTRHTREFNINKIDKWFKELGYTNADYEVWPLQHSTVIFKIRDPILAFLTKLTWS